MTNPERAIRLFSGMLLIMMLSACAAPKLFVRAPAPTHMKYQTSSPAPAKTLAFQNKEPAGSPPFLNGILALPIKYKGAVIDAPKFLGNQLQAELTSRGLPVRVQEGGTDMPRVVLHAFNIEDSRTNGFAPFITFTFVSADLETKSGTHRIGVFVKRGKVPVWKFDEVIQPTLNEPLSIAVKELASKISNVLYGYRASDEVVDNEIARISAGRSKTTYLDVYRLGFTNNPKAIPELVRLTGDKAEYVRLAAISSLGTIGATDKLGLLESIYESKSGLWQDRAMALKAIGDLGTPEAKAYLRAQLANVKANGKGKNISWTSQIIHLYI